MIGIGIDTGGTYTDAVVYDLESKEILGSGKSPTTKQNLEIGIDKALGMLPQNLLEKAELLALSTTLATNACVENKGARAKLLMIGFETSMIDHLKNIYASYGFHDTSQFIVLDAKAEHLFSHPYDPDWEELKRRIPEYFSSCDAVGVVQKHPRANGARFEKKAGEILKNELDIPVTLANDISDEVDILKCCAGTMLNARLIPLLEEFIAAVRHVIQKRGLHIPLAIVRSDGSLMSEEMAKEFPVETLLSGPAASVVGGSALAKQDNAMIVDMGGTTTDIAIVREKEPVMAKSGIHIGQWKTMVKGLYVETFGLGGDSAVRYKDGELFLDTVRVIPISFLAAEYPSVLPKLKKLAAEKRFHASWIHEFYVLQKDLSGKYGYSEEEQKICEALKDGPLITMELAAIMDKDPHFLRTDRLEEEGIVMKSGLTPTDMMVIKGDFSLYDAEAAKTALLCLKKNVNMETEEIPDHVYDLVIGKMYKNIGRILLSQQYGKQIKTLSPEAMDCLLTWHYEQAKDRKAKTPEGECRLSLQTNLPLIGVGAPIHIFLPEVAGLLGTKAVIPPYAGVANAIGAIASRIVARVTVRVKAEYKNAYCYGYSVFEDGERHLYPEYEDAEAFARDLARREVLKKAKKQGTSSNPEVVVSVEKIGSAVDGSGVLFETLVTAAATDTFHVA